MARGLVPKMGLSSTMGNDSRFLLAQARNPDHCDEAQAGSEFDVFAKAANVMALDDTDHRHARALGFAQSLLDCFKCGYLSETPTSGDQD